MPCSLLRNWILITVSAFALTTFTGCSGCRQETADATPPPVETDTESPEKPETAASETAADASPTQPDNAAAPGEKSDHQAQSASTAAMPKQPAASSADAPNGGESDSGATPNLTAEEALEKAGDLYRSAQSQGGNAGQAFQEAAQAWELLNQHPEDAECQAMASKILQQLDAMAAKANQTYSGKLSEDRMLIER